MPPPRPDDLRDLLCDLFRGGDELLEFMVRQPDLRELVDAPLRAISRDKTELAAAIASAAAGRGRQRELLDALRVHFPGRRAAIDAVAGRTAADRAAHLAGGPILAVVAARTLAALLFVAALALPWLAIGLGALDRPTERRELAPTEVQYRPELVLIPGGRFVMGSSAEERAAFEKDLPEKLHGQMEDEVQHEVEVGAIYVARTEVTLAQWEAVMGTRPSDCDYGCEDRHPVQNVSWNDACAYANALTERENEVLHVRGEGSLTPCYVAAGESWEWPEERWTCTGYRLPTEAEWEYFARADTTTAYWFGDDPKDMCAHGNGLDLSATRKHPDWEQPDEYGPVFPCEDGYSELAPAGKFTPNPWGLHDVHGNVVEWVWDWYPEDTADDGSDKTSDTSDTSDKPDNGVSRQVTNGPHGPQNGVARVLRGGSFGVWPGWLRAADRGRCVPTDRYWNYGFRVVRVPPSTSP